MSEAAAILPAEVRARITQVKERIGAAVVGMDREIELLLCAVLAERHVLVEGVPGLGKTHLVKTLARVLGCDFRRIQFTPDLLPADILGGHVYRAHDGTFTLRKGPIFTNVVLADEINRAPAKTQSALLEVMQERQATIEGETLKLPRPFFVFATQNPLEHEGVYPLPQAQLDRFAMRLLVSHPSAEAEHRILAAHRKDLTEPAPVLDAATIAGLQGALESVVASDEVLQLIVRLGEATRKHEGVALGASPRVGIDLMRLARARAVLHQRGHITPDDVKALYLDVVNHRISLMPRAEFGGLTVAEVVRDAMRSTQLV